MATSDTYSTSNQYIKYRVVMTQNSQDTTNNRSNITVKVQAWRTNSYTTYGSGTCYCTIDGTRYSQSITSDDKISYNSYTTLFEKTLNISHNSDGTKSVYISAQIDHSQFDSSDQGESYTLTAIPRYATISTSLASKSINSITINWSSDVNVDTFQYKIGSGSWVDAEKNINKKSGSFTIPNLSPNTAYALSFDAKRKDSQQWSTWGGKGTYLNVTTYDIGKISSVSNFNHGSSTTLVTTNPSGSALGLVMKIGNTQILSKSVSTGSNTITFNDTQLDSIYRLYGSGNTLTATFILTTANNANYTNTKTATITLKGNQKTAYVGVSGKKRAKVYVGVSGSVKQAVVWVGNNGNRRCI